MKPFHELAVFRWQLALHFNPKNGRRIQNGCRWTDESYFEMDMKILQYFHRGVVNVFRRPTVTSVILFLLLSMPAMAATVRRAIHIETAPAEATVEILFLPADGDARRRKIIPRNDLETEVLKFYEKDSVLITASAKDYESVTNLVRFEDLHTEDASTKNPFRQKITLPQLRQEIPVELLSEGDTTFSINNVQTRPATSMVFVRDNSRSRWHPVTIKAERLHYKTLEANYEHDAVETLPLRGGRRQLNVLLEEIERPAKLLVTANESGARVFLDGTPATTTPGEVPLMFTRDDGNAPWSTHVLRVEKEEYEYRPAGLLLGLPAFQTNLTFDAVKALNQKIYLPEFQPVRFFQVPMYRFRIAKGETKLEVTNSISAKDGNDAQVAKLLEFGGNPRGEAVIAGRIGAALLSNAQGKPGQVVLTLPVTNPRPGEPSEIVGTQIYLLNASGSSTPVTDGEPGIYDFDPCITKDGKTVYYSSDHGGQRGIWKKSVGGQGRSPIDPGRGVDVEPSVFTSSEGNTRVAFTRYSLRAAVGTPPFIVVQEEDRLSFAETRRGRSPAWSNDGSKIAYVSADNKICVMDANGENSRVLTAGKSVDDSPVWLPGDQQIAYASAISTAEARNGTGNYDLWRVDLDGNTQQIVSNLSFDGMPALTSEALVGEGKQGTLTYIYFISNRGAQRTGADIWKVHYFELH